MVKGVAVEGEGGDAKIGMEGKGGIKGLVGGIGGGGEWMGRRGGGGRRDRQQGRVGGGGSHYGGRGLMGGLGGGGQRRGERDKEEGDEGEGEVAGEEGIEVKKVAMEGESGVAKVSMDGWAALRASLVGLEEEEEEKKGGIRRGGGRGEGVRRKGRKGKEWSLARKGGVGGSCYRVGGFMGILGRGGRRREGDDEEGKGEGWIAGEKGWRWREPP